MRWFLNKWFDALVDFPEGPPRIASDARARFHNVIAQHRRGIEGPDAAWGWKSPRSMWIIPFYLSVFPNLRFIHVVRDGRDMSLTANMRLLQRHGDRLIGHDWRQNPMAAQMTLWWRGNLRAADAKTQCAQGHYMLLRYEDLCARPDETVGRLYDFLGAPQALVKDGAAEIRSSPGIGRGRAMTKEEADRLDPRFWQALEAFGYA
jgi:hypothetical protein